MSVLVTILMRGDAKKFEQIAVDDPSRMRSIAERGREHGAIAHRFYATDDGDVMVIDEWPDAESFNRFFESMQAEIGPLMQEAGVTSEPAVRFWRKLETGDDMAGAPSSFRPRIGTTRNPAPIEPAEDSGRPSGGLEERDSAAESGPRFVAGEHPVGRHLVRCCEHERVRESQASGVAAKTSGRSAIAGVIASIRTAKSARNASTSATASTPLRYGPTRISA